MRITFMLWRGDIGGAERFSIELAAALRTLGHEAEVLFVTDEFRLRPQLDARKVPYRSLGMDRGRDVTREPRKAAAALKAWSTDVVISVTVGYLGAALRAGGFRGPIIGIEHGNLIHLLDGSVWRKPGALLNRVSGVVTHDAEVAVSQFMAGLVRQVPHARVSVIPHGVAAASSPLPVPASDILTIGYVGRLYAGKGVDVLLRATVILREKLSPTGVRVRIAGSGPMDSEWRALAQLLGVNDIVSFEGWIDDLDDHWRGCHVCVAPNDTFSESFCMSVVEAMARGRATVVTRLGALPELVVNGETGAVVQPGNPTELASALQAYGSVRETSAVHGRAAWNRANESYSLRAVAEAYARLCGRVLDDRRGKS